MMTKNDDQQEEIRQALKQLQLHYKVYADVCKTKYCQTDSKILAEESLKGFLEYVTSCMETYPHWRKNIPCIIYNEIRILRGMIECYNKPIDKANKSFKTRVWL